MWSAKPEGIRPQTYYLPTLRRHAVPRPFPPGKSDQCLIQLTPTYKPLVRRQPITTGTVKQWSVEVEWALIVFQDNWLGDVFGGLQWRHLGSHSVCHRLHKVLWECCPHQEGSLLPQQQTMDEQGHRSPVEPEEESFHGRGQWGHTEGNPERNEEGTEKG